MSIHSQFLSRFLRAIGVLAVIAQLFLTSMLSASATKPSLLRSLYNTASLDGCEGAHFAPFSSSGPISDNGLTPTELLYAISVANQLPKLNLRQRMEYSFNGFEKARLVALKILSELKVSPQFYEINLPTFSGFTYTSNGGVLKTNFTILSSTQILQKLEKQLQGETRVGYFPTLIRELFAFERFFIKNEFSETQELPIVDIYRMTLKNSIEVLISQMRQGALNYPFPDHFGGTEMTLGWAFGVIPFGVMSGKSVEYDGFETDSREEFGLHDDIHYHQFLFNLLEASSVEDHRPKLKLLYQSIAQIQTDKDLELVHFLWGYFTHEVELLNDIVNGLEFTQASLVNRRALDAQRLVLRLKRPKDYIDLAPPQLQELIWNNQDAEAKKEIMRGMQILNELLVGVL